MCLLTARIAIEAGQELLVAVRSHWIEGTARVQYASPPVFHYLFQLLWITIYCMTCKHTDREHAA